MRKAFSNEQCNTKPGKKREGGSKVGGGGGGVKREIIYLSLHYHHQNDFCIMVSSDESHFNVS